ncbi:hypothetical protein B0H15DRAFT_33457 [Mycena belliarum]|uniref:Uncharacterized protein n=1 Tax=Mycena belliarum TaxID=1033014 RepID=A0AAD6UDA6_9AGAR|nr:hypothetical protein B0H15DRAFT_33457 [Mycena belliae]
MADDIQASLREKTIQNHRLDSKVGELEIRMSHLSEDLAKACAERDRSQDECKELSRHLLTVCEELKDVTTKYEALKLMVPLPSDHKRKRDADADDQSLGPAFEQRSITHSTPTNVSNSPYDSEPTTPKRLPTLHYRSTSTISTDTSPCASPGPENSLRGTGGLPPPWLQTVRATTSSPQPGSVSTRSNTPNVLDSQRTTDPRKRLKVDANQTPTRPTFPADQKSTPTPSNTTPQTGKGSPISNKMPRTTPTRVCAPSRS